MAKKTKTVSVIMPVYNAAGYLEESLCDLLNQTFKDFELICVNDGSTDESKDIIEAFAKKDARIRFVSQINKGGGAARNTGFDVASGEYVLFLDADDRFENTLLEKTVEAAKKEKCDVLIFGADEFHYETGVKRPAPWLLQSGYEKYDGNPFHYTTTTVWNKLFRRGYLVKNSIRHQDERVTAFSMYFTFFALIYTSKISFLDEVLVHYRSENPQSSMRRHDSSPLDTLNILETIWNRIQTDGELLSKKDIYLNFAIKNIFERSGWFHSYESFAEMYEELHSGGLSRIGLTDENDKYIENKSWLEIKHNIAENGLSEFLFIKERTYKEKGILAKNVYFLPEEISNRLIKEKARVILYGAGMVGKCYFQQLKNIKEIAVVSWIDEKADELGFPYQKPEIVRNVSFDYVVVGVEHRRFLAEIKNRLRTLDIFEEKIIWEVPHKQL